ncbi:hypothetical protein GGR50DRAFT_689760 [Xylaria sp. CBS 124048]|nr:hypothetical protein GGR50DRAFT_689760 [Xylaria sp. CBS 124048]
MPPRRATNIEEFLRRKKTDLFRSTVLGCVTGTVKIDERWPRKVFKGPPTIPPDYQISIEVALSLDALYVLQATREQYLLGSALAVPLQFQHDSLPYMVQKDVGILPAVQFDFWHASDWEEFLTDERLAELKERYHEQLTSRRFHFWPIDLNRADRDQWDIPHWGLIVMHMRNTDNPDEEDPDHDEKVKPFNVLHCFAVINPDHGEAARELEEDVIQELLFILRTMGITVDGSLQREPWVPPSMNAPQLRDGDQKEYWSSGLRVFDLARTLLNRIASEYSSTPHTIDSEIFWASHSGWFNPDAVRSDMIGMAATMVNRAMNGTTRVAIEPIIDNNMNITDERGVTTVTHTVAMQPDRRQVGVFDRTRSRDSPRWFDDRVPEEPNDSSDRDEGEEGQKGREDEGEDDDVDVDA